MTRKRNLTAQIKPATRNAIMDQLALAADTIIRYEAFRLEAIEQCWRELNALPRPWYRRLLDWVRP